MREVCRPGPQRGASIYIRHLTPEGTWKEEELSLLLRGKDKIIQSLTLLSFSLSLPTIWKSSCISNVSLSHPPKSTRWTYFNKGSLKVKVIHPEAVQDVQTFLCHLSNKLFNSFAGSHTSKRSKLALLAMLQQTTAPLLPQFPLVEVRSSQTQGAVMSSDSSSASALRNRAEAASAQTG